MIEQVNYAQVNPPAEVRQVFDVKKAVAEIRTLAKESERNFLKIGRLLHAILESEGYTQLGFKNFEDFLEGNFSFERRTAQMLVRVWVYFGKGKAIKVAEEELAEIGYTKAYVLTQLWDAEVLNEENLKEWLEKAKTLSYRAFKLEADRAMGKLRKTEDELNWKWVRLRVPPEDVEFIKEVVYDIALLEGIEDEREIEKREGELIVKALRDWHDYYYPVLDKEKFSQEEVRQFKLRQVKSQLEGTLEVSVHIYDKRTGQRIV